jgi:hypothetical protein
MKFLSYCTTCMDRLWQLEQTLPYNLSKLKDDEEICLVNYNSKDGLDEYIRNNFTKEIEDGRLKYFYTKDPQFFHASKAKNLAHRLGSGGWLFNLDGDNFINKTSRWFIDSMENICAFHEWEGSYADGTYGRICIKREVFFAIGGYNEKFNPIYYEDIDLKKRCAFFSKSGKIIKNCHKLEIMPIMNNNVDILGKKSSEMNKVNSKISSRNIRSRRIKANSKGMEKYSGELNLSGKEIIM